jgi:hypothetical protein
MTSRPIGLSISHPFGLLTLAFLALCPLIAADASASYATEGALSVNTEGGPFVFRQIPPSTTVEISDQDVSIGGAGNNATAAYSVSILDAAISASTSAQNGLHAPGDFWSASAAVNSTSFRDDLRFSIPAGSYPSGLYAVAHVHVSGSVGASVGAAARYLYGFQFGVDFVNVNTTAPAANLSTVIELTHELLAPGTTLNEPVTRLVPYNGTVESQSSAPGEVLQSASSDISGRVLCIDVPLGVTWVSDSGVFGATHCADAVPSLTGWAIAALVIVLGGSAIWFAGLSRRELA